MLRLEELRSSLTNLLENQDEQAIQKWLDGAHPADLALLLNEFDPEKRAIIFSNIQDEELQQEVLMFANADIKAFLFSLLDPNTQVNFVEDMPRDEAVDLVEELNDETADNLMERLPPATASELQGLRQYEEGTAGALMTTEYLQVRSEAKIQDVIKILGTNRDLESIDTGFVLTDGGKILGAFDVSEVLVHRGNPFIMQFVYEDIIYVEDTASENVAYKLMTRHGLDILPVVNSHGFMVGIITADDMLEVAKKVSDQDFYHMVGTSDPVGSSVFARAGGRIPWLLATLVGGLFAGVILKQYNLELQHFTVLVIFLPFVIAMAGNVGVQSATIIVRELANHDSSDSAIRKNVIKEMLTGMVNAGFFGLTIFALLSAYVYFFDSGSYIIGPAIGLALACSMSLAGCIGANIPLLFARMNVDPAISSGPIITMTMDILGLTIYLGVSTWIFALNHVEVLHF
jgi:magnesium transporter